MPPLLVLPWAWGSVKRWGSEQGGLSGLREGRGGISTRGAGKGRQRDGVLIGTCAPKSVAASASQVASLRQDYAALEAARPPRRAAAPDAVARLKRLVLRQHCETLLPGADAGAGRPDEQLRDTARDVLVRFAALLNTRPVVRLLHAGPKAQVPPALVCFWGVARDAGPRSPSRVLLNNSASPGGGGGGLAPLPPLAPGFHGGKK